MAESFPVSSSLPSNCIHRFTFADHPIRGEFVQLSTSYHALCEHHNYPAPVAALLGELLAVTSLLTATLKFKGHINVQLQGSGALNFATVNGQHDQSLRGLARLRDEIHDPSLLGMLGENALLIITLTPEKGERYQGMIKVEDNQLSTVIERYFMQSEQLPTRLWLYADPATAVCAGFFLQVLPVAPDTNEPGAELAAQAESFEHLVTLADTLTKAEMFELSVQQILHRLYHEEDIHLFPEQAVTFFCGCSHEKTAEALRSLDMASLNEIIEEDGKLVLTCDYCLKNYHYDAIDVAALHTHTAPPQAQ